MTNVLIVHGVGGYPEENWFPWLKKRLEMLGYNVLVPQFPTPENQKLNSWLKVLDRYENQMGKNPVVIGHSLGVPFLLNVLEKTPAKAAFFVAGFFGKAGNDFDPAMKTFAQRKFDWTKIGENCKHFEVFHSDNDPYIALEKGEELAVKLGVRLTLVKGAGHFNERAGYTKFPLLLEAIREEMKRKHRNG
jgi:hypothetical protein